MSRLNRPVDNALAEAARPLASWYTPGVSDGLGDRLLMFDNTDEPSLELLRFRAELVAASGFEHALRARARELRDFTDPAFPQIRAIESLEGGGLALVSTFTPGKRFGEVFQQSRSRLDPKSALRIIQDLTEALAALHRRGDGMSHGCLTPDRVVITPEGRLVIVEHVLGAALNTVRLSPEQVAQDLGLVLPAMDGPAGAQFDSRTDVTQLGWTVLSMLVGRRLNAADYPIRSEALVNEFVRGAESRWPELVATLQSWLESALRIKGDTFESAVDALEALSSRRLGSGTNAQTMALRDQRGAEARRLALVEPSLTPIPAPRPDALPPAAGAYDIVAPAEASALPTEVAESPVPHGESARLAAVLGALRSANRRTVFEWGVMIILALAAVVQGIALARLGSARQAPAAPPSIDWNALTAEAKSVRDAAATPAPAAVATAGEAARRPGAPAPASTVPAPVAAPPPAVAARSQPVEDAKVAAALAQAESRQRRGGLQVASPFEVQVLEGDRVLGSSAEGPIVATIGRHEWEFVNNALGYRTRQVVEIKAGKIGKLTLSPENGRVSINAAPWAQVTVDGTAVGETPIANLSLSAGEHQITFQHPQLGERTERVVVKAGAATRVSVTFAR